MNNESLNPPSPPDFVTPSPPSRPAHSNWSGPRFKIHQPTSSKPPTTPSALRFNSPFTPTPIKRASHFATSSKRKRPILSSPQPFLPRNASTSTTPAIKRRLFTITTPTSALKNSSNSRNRSYPLSFQIAGNQDRTQPEHLSNTPSKRIRPTGPLSTGLAKMYRLGSLHAKLAKPLLRAVDIDTEELCKLFDGGLVLRVEDAQAELVTASCIDLIDEKIQVVIPKDFQSDTSDLEGNILFVPKPWTSVNHENGLLVVASQTVILDEKDLDVLRTHCSINQALRISLDKENLRDCQQPNNTAYRGHTLQNKGSCQQICKGFDYLPPHATRITILVTVERLLPQFGIVIVCDQQRKRAVMHMNESEYSQNSKIKVTASICHIRISGAALLRILREKDADMGTITTEAFAPHPDQQMLVIKPIDQNSIQLGQ